MRYLIFVNSAIFCRLDVATHCHILYVITQLLYVITQLLYVITQLLYVITQLLYVITQHLLRSERSVVARFYRHV